jgi:hypothetical protein
MQHRGNIEFSSDFKLKEEEIMDLESFKDHCIRSAEYIKEYLDLYLNKDFHDKDLLQWIHAENTRGIEVIADHNIMNNELRTIQDLEKRFSKWCDQ